MTSRLQRTDPESWWTGCGREDYARTPHDPAKFGEFRRRYTAELAEPGPRDALNRIRALAAHGPVTLLTATRAIDISQAAVLAGLLREVSGLPARPPPNSGPPGLGCVLAR
jgi:uncharacterized protein DUF488